VLLEAQELHDSVPRGWEVEVKWAQQQVLLEAHELHDLNVDFCDEVYRGSPVASYEDQ